MPRSFSLARLMLGITLLCIACGVAFYLPEKGLFGWLALLFVLPPGLPMLGFVVFARDPWQMFFVTLLGAIAGFLLFPLLYVILVVTISDIRWTSQHANFALFILFPTGATLGVLLAGTLHHHLLHRRSK
jgi:hypothetical protein